VVGDECAIVEWIWGGFFRVNYECLHGAGGCGGHCFVLAAASFLKEYLL